MTSDSHTRASPVPGCPHTHALGRVTCGRIGARIRPRRGGHVGGPARAPVRPPTGRVGAFPGMRCARAQGRAPHARMHTGRTRTRRGAMRRPGSASGPRRNLSPRPLSACLHPAGKPGTRITNKPGTLITNRADRSPHLSCRASSGGAAARPASRALASSLPGSRLRGRAPGSPASGAPSLPSALGPPVAQSPRLWGLTGSPAFGIVRSLRAAPRQSPQGRSRGGVDR